MRAYKTGDQDVYKFSMTAGPNSLKATFTDTVSKVYGNGDADISEKTTDAVSTTAAGPQADSSVNESVELKVTQYGTLVGVGPASPASLVIFTLAIPGTNSGLALNDSVAFKRTLRGATAAETPPEISGTVSLVSLAGGEAKLKVTATMSAPAKNQPPNKIDGFVVWNVKLGRYTKADLTISNLLTPKTPFHILVERTP